MSKGSNRRKHDKEADKNYSNSKLWDNLKKEKESKPLNQ
jgi:hypothetical protein